MQPKKRNQGQFATAENAKLAVTITAMHTHQTHLKERK